MIDFVPHSASGGSAAQIRDLLSRLSRPKDAVDGQKAAAGMQAYTARVFFLRKARICCILGILIDRTLR